LERDRKRKRGLNYFVYVHRGIGDNHCTLQRVKVHARWREPFTFTLVCPFKFPNYRWARIQANASISICLKDLLSHRLCGVL